MKKNILLSLLILFSIQVMSQEKGAHISIWGGVGPTAIVPGPTGFKYKIEGVNFATPKCEVMLGGQAGLGFSYYFTKHVGITIGVGMSHYRTTTRLENFEDKFSDEFFMLGSYKNFSQEWQFEDYDLRVRIRNWSEYHSVKFLEVPLLLNFQKKFGEKEYFGLYLSIGAKFQLPVIANYSVVDGDNEKDPKLWVSMYNAEDNIELDGVSGGSLSQHGLGKIHNPSEVLNDSKGKLDLKFNISAVAEAGILISLSRRVDLSLGAFIDYGLMDINKKGDTKALFTGPENDYVPGSEDNIGNGITYNSILKSTYDKDNSKRYVNKISTFSYGGKIGLRIKLGKLAQKQQPQLAFAPTDRDTIYVYKDKDTVYISKYEAQPIALDSIIKELKDALKEMPRYDRPIGTIDDSESYLPDYIPEEEVDILFGPIYFDLDKAILKPQSIKDLDKKVEILKKYPEIKLVIFGNTCDLGTDPYNYKLGQRRAEAAKNYLISKGIPAERLESSTLSRFQPEAPNTNEPNRMHNRRDDFKPIYPRK